MLLILMYHQIYDPGVPIQITLDKFERHLRYLQNTFNISLPGQTLLRKNVCLTFENADVDFYNYIFPMLKKLNIPAVLAIPTGLIADSTNLAITSSLQFDLLKTNNNDAQRVGLCTWEEIQKMLSSGLIYPGSNSLSYRNLTSINFSEIYKELCVSKRMILTKLEKIAEIFIYPFGRFNNKIHAMAIRHYRHIMRIGEASNTSWNQNILYRIDADRFWKNDKKFSEFNFLFWKIKYWWNKLRNK